MERLDLRQVEYFLAVAEELHFGRAAARLHIAQPSLSQQIRRLEDRVGVPLLTRTSRRVELTPAGEVFLREGRRALAQATRALEAARAQERLTVGFSGSAGHRLLAPTLAAYGALRPAVAVTPTELALSATSEIRSGMVDVAFTRLAPGETDLEVEVLDREPRVAVLPRSHARAGCDALRLADLSDEWFVTTRESFNPRWRRRWHAEQARHGLSGRVAAEATSLEQLLTLVAAGVGVCVVPASTAGLYPRTGVVYRPVTDAEPALVSLAWSRANDRPALRDFRDAARTAAREDAAAPAVAHP